MNTECWVETTYVVTKKNSDQSPSKNNPIKALVHLRHSLLQSHNYEKHFHSTFILFLFLHKHQIK